MASNKYLDMVTLFGEELAKRISESSTQLDSSYMYYRYEEYVPEHPPPAPPEKYPEKLCKYCFMKASKCGCGFN